MTTVSNKIKELRDTRQSRVYLACTGAGAGLQKMLWDVPGASSFLVGASFPYDMSATDEFLGFKPEKYCSADTAIELAMASFYRATEPGKPPAVGIGLTASVASTREHRGDHRVFAAWFSERGCQVHQVTLHKGVGEEARILDGEVADRIGLDALLDSLGIDPPEGGVSMVAESGLIEDGSERAKALFFKHPFFRADGTRIEKPEELTSFLPGAFNPPHEGHFGMAKIFSETVGRRAVFSTTCDPPHKEALSVAEMLKRAKLLKGHDRIFTKGDPTFLDKARALPGSSFIIGADALHRMMDPRWGFSAQELVSQFAELQTHFYVFDRMHEGRLLTLYDLQSMGVVPMDLSAQPLRGQWDISSSELRARLSQEKDNTNP